MSRFVFLLAVSLFCSQAPAARSPQSNGEGTTGFWEEFHRPADPYRGPPRSGRQIYEYRCKACHARGTQGAPMVGDTYDWSQRAKQGVETLLKHAKQGYARGLMPPRGGCGNCSDAELRAAIEYMLEKSGIRRHLPAPKP